MNIGFSQNKHLTKSQKQRLAMVNFAEEHGSGAAVKEFGTTLKILNQWISRYHQDGINGLADNQCPNIQLKTSLTNRSKSRLTTLKPRNKASFRSADSKISESTNLETAPVDIVEEVKLETPAVPELTREIRIEKKFFNSRSIHTDIKTIQIGVVNLLEIDGYGDVCKKNGLPSWQFTAFDPQTGGAWISYSYEAGLEQQIDFLKAICKHLISHGIQPEKLNFELCTDPVQKETSGIEDILEQCFSGRIVVKSRISESGSPIDMFDRLLEDDFYRTIRVTRLSKLLEKAETFLLQYNYRRNFRGSSYLPPNQLICRQYGEKSGPELLNFRPFVIKGSQAGRAKHLLGLRMMAGMFASMAGFVLSRGKRIRRAGITNIINKTASPVAKLSDAAKMPETKTKSVPHSTQDTKPADNKFEYISLKNISWDKPAEKQAKPDVNTGRVRNRQELINRAKELLAQKRSISELKHTLSMTEGELSMLSQNITFSDKERK